MELIDGDYTSPRWSFEFLDCSMPMTFDTYGNCAFHCVYCFSAFQRSLGINDRDGYLNGRVKAVDPERIKNMFSNPDEYAGQFAWYIKARHTMQWGGLSDAFDYFERDFGVSLDLLRFFREIEYPLSISTKGAWIAEDKRYTDLLQNADHIHMKVSIITLNEYKAKRIERGVASPLQRLEFLRKLNEIGVGATTLRLRPFILGATDDGLEELIARAADAGCYSVSSEFLCVEGRAGDVTIANMKALSEVVGYDIIGFYRRNTKGGGGLMRLNYEIKRKHFDELERLCDKYGLKLFISDAHHKEKCAGVSCCGIPPDNLKLNNYRNGNYTDALLIAKDKGYVLWVDIDNEAKALHEIPWGRADGFNQGTTRNKAKYLFASLYDVMRDVWNNPNSKQSPGKYFGGALVAAGRDNNGDVIYLYNRPYIEKGEVVRSVKELAEVLGIDMGLLCAE
jgi:DNA repair photolyase